MSLPNFVLPTEHTFDWTVKVWVPIDGVKKASKLNVTFKHVPPGRRLEILNLYREVQTERAQALLALPGEADDEFEAPPAAELDHLTFEQDLLEEVMVGFDLKDKDGEPVEFNDITLDALLKFDPARAACMHAYMQALNGQAPEKNSSRRRKPGPKR